MASCIGRRKFLATLGGAAAAWPLAARAQQTKRIFKVGHLESGLPSSSPYLLAAFQQGLRKLGYIEGENLFIERRYAEGLEERLPQLAAELVRFGVDVIFAIGPPQALAVEMSELDASPFSKGGAGGRRHENHHIYVWSERPANLAWNGCGRAV
jgi:hypothetical protein